MDSRSRLRSFFRRCRINVSSLGSSGSSTDPGVAGASVVVGAGATTRGPLPWVDPAGAAPHTPDQSVTLAPRSDVPANVLRGPAVTAAAKAVEHTGVPPTDMPAPGVTNPSTGTPHEEEASSGEKDDGEDAINAGATSSIATFRVLTCSSWMREASGKKNKTDVVVHACLGRHL